MAISEQLKHRILKIPRKERANKIDHHVGSMLHQYRLHAGLSQRELGEKVGITFQQVQKYENGTNRISASRLYQFAKILNITVGAFFETYEIVKKINRSKNSYGDDLLHTDIMGQKETQSLIRVYYSLNDPKLRRELLVFIKSLANNLKADG